MDALQREEQRRQRTESSLRGTGGQEAGGQSRSSTMINGSWTAMARPPFKQQQQNHVIDLTNDSSDDRSPKIRQSPHQSIHQQYRSQPSQRPLPSTPHQQPGSSSQDWQSDWYSNPFQTPSRIANLSKTSYEPSSKMTPASNSWQLPPKNKHAAPSKVRMIESNESLPQAAAPKFNTGADRPLPTSRINAPVASAAKKVVREGIDIAKWALEEGLARMNSHSDHDPNKPSSGRAAQQEGAEVGDEDLPPLPDKLADPTLTEAEREQQLQDMLSSMVLPPELSDIDLEKASHVEGLRCKLLPHQIAGYLWLKGREGGRHKGGILADDMGLGKTVQTLALIVGNAPIRAETTINKIRLEPSEVKAKMGRKVVPDDDEAPREEAVNIKSKTTLIIAPLAVIRQWETEIREKTSPVLRVLVHHGTSRTKSSASFAKYDVVITTYPTVASEFKNVVGVTKPKKSKSNGRKAKSGRHVVLLDSDEDDSDSGDGEKGLQSVDSDASSSSDQLSKPVTTKKKAKPPSPLFEADWLRIVLDEAQCIKSHKTQASTACAALSRRGLAKWCLTGTPIQNEALEMFSLIRFLAIPPFDQYSHFREKISDPLKSKNQNRANWGMRRLCAVLTTIMLRRTKDTTYDGKPILSLPGRNVELVSFDFEDDKERQFYTELLNKIQQNLEAHEDSGTKVNHMLALVMLLRLRQACSHPSLVNRKISVDAGAASGPSTKSVEGGEDDDSGDDGLAAMLSGLSVNNKRCERCQGTLKREEADRGNHCKECARKVALEGNVSPWQGKRSTKINHILRILDDIRTKGDEKTIIFSQFTSFLDVLEPFLREESHKFVRYDGSMRPEEREKCLDRIRRDGNTRVILISFKAGNVGLNLTSCSRVILTDLWWNPMLEAQSIDRAHRLGQQRDVHVYKLVIKDSVEERILAIQDKKRALAEAALEGSKLTKANRLDKKELMYLFSRGPIS